MPVGSKPLRSRAPWAVWAVVAALAVGLLARFLTRSPMWLDEALSVHIAELPVGDIPEALRRDGHPPLYYVMLHGWMSVFGSGEVAARALSGVLAVATLPLAWVAGRRLGGPSVAAWALVVLALSPFAVRYATEARMYALVMLLVLAGYLLLTDSLRQPTGRRLAGLSLIAGALLWTHYWSLYLVVVTGAGMLLVAWRSAALRGPAIRVAGALVAGGLLFLPWLPSMLAQLRDTGTPWAAPSRPTAVAAVTLDDLGGGGFAEARLLGALSLLLLVVALLGRRRDAGTVELRAAPEPTVRWELAVAAVTLGLGALVALAASSAYASRYAAVVVPLLLLGVAVGLSSLPRPGARAAVAGAYVLLALVGVANNVVEPRSQARQHARHVADAGGAGDLVVACPDQLGPSTLRALEREGLELPVVPYPTGEDPRFVDWRDYEERNASADPIAFAEQVDERAGPAQVWVVWRDTYRTFEGQCEALVGRLAELRGSPEQLGELGDRLETSRLFRYG